jgi:hypothetical protein
MLPKVGHLGQKSVTRHIARPPNCFMIWSTEMRKKIAETNPHIPNTYISKHLGELWMSMTKEYQLHYKLKAEQVKHAHTLTNPGYKYTPKTKKYLTQIYNKRVIHKTEKFKKCYKMKTHKNATNVISTVISTVNPNVITLESEEPDYYSEIETFYNSIPL